MGQKKRRQGRGGRGWNLPFLMADFANWITGLNWCGELNRSPPPFFPPPFLRKRKAFLLGKAASGFLYLRDFFLLVNANDVSFFLIGFFRSPACPPPPPDKYSPFSPFPKLLFFCSEGFSPSYIGGCPLFFSSFTEGNFLRRGRGRSSARSNRLSLPPANVSSFFSPSARNPSPPERSNKLRRAPLPFSLLFFFFFPFPGLAEATFFFLDVGNLVWRPNRVEILFLLFLFLGRFSRSKLRWRSLFSLFFFPAGGKGGTFFFFFSPPARSAEKIP